MNLRLVQQIREINPTARIIAHAELFAEIPKLYAAGANFVSVPRMSEAKVLRNAILAALEDRLDATRAESDQELRDRREVIP